jgi:CBS-domain-containing membrane protein
VVTVRADAPLEDVVTTMKRHQIRRVPVVDESGCCVGIIAQADLASQARPGEAAELLRELSRHIPKA